ncbi:hypothetical protein GCM10010954_23540 [Halobacillus andaensis]|uniref:Flp/Fap pilin component n=1 Tax=Halobacillus andaensis TaxID=1176239 RepID=A0A917B7X0_HALAA|nr:Flp family type IVb pilin [Halobacillus andaensis]MBP2006055.1 pilus assembly protein Flp/PilA [Halobacillus andaensis]GGF23948.1 hypothetical protein GCM10010954_23540 [Halobacillus andaensis]
MEMMKRLWQEEEGQAMAEYGLILALIAVFVVTALTALGGQIETVFKNITTELGGTSGGGDASQ